MFTDPHQMKIKENANWMWVLFLLSLVGVVALILFPYSSGYNNARHPMMVFMNWHWRIPDWQHCLLVPFMIGWLLWKERKALGELEQKPAASGFLVFIFASILYWIGYRMNIFYIGYFSVQLMFSGVLLATLGTQVMRYLLFHWLFLTFFWPLPFLDHTFSFHLRLVLTHLTADFLNLIQVPTIQSGTSLLSAPDLTAELESGARFSLNVEGPCSGMRSLFALMMVGAVYSYITQKILWKRWLLFLCSIPMAMFGNFMRLVILALCSGWFGSEFAIGKTTQLKGGHTMDDISTFHFISGVILFLVAFSGLVFIGKLLLGKIRISTLKERVFGRNQTRVTHLP